MEPAQVATLILVSINTFQPGSKPGLKSLIFHFSPGFSINYISVPLTRQPYTSHFYSLPITNWLEFLKYFFTSNENSEAVF